VEDAPAVGLVFEVFGAYPRRPQDPDDFEAEYEPEATVEALEAALRLLGCRPLRLGRPRDLLADLGRGRLPPLAAALSIAEGYGSRNREGWAPALLEMADVPLLGSDALTLGLCLDKLWAHRAAAAAGVPVPAFASLASPEEARRAPLPAGFPLFVKPRWEGTAKGIRPTSRVSDRDGLVREVERVVAAYRQPALVEAFVGGPEYTVTVVGHDPPRALAVLQRALEARTGIGVHALEAGRDPQAPPLEHVLPGCLTSELEERLQQLAQRVFRALECRDFARLDFRLDEGGTPRFLEINPLPTFAPDATFGILAELEGRPLPELLADVLGEALRRQGVRTRRPAAAPRAPEAPAPENPVGAAPAGPPSGSGSSRGESR